MGISLSLLCVEDNQSVASLAFTEIEKAFGADVMMVGGADALSEALGEREFDLILCAYRSASGFNAAEASPVCCSISPCRTWTVWTPSGRFARSGETFP
jgi:hypothetical protein